jgi:hypothetical protein
VKRLLQVVAAVVWVLVAGLLAFGGAGIVAAMNHVPGTASRPELTWTADEAAKAQLDAATDRLQAVTTEVESMGTFAREALAATTAGDVDKVNEIVAAATLQLDAVDHAASELQAAIDAVPGVGPGNELRVSPEIQDRYDGLASTPAFTTTLREDWTTFTGRALDAANLNALLANHDQQTAAAAQQGAKTRYKQAVALLDDSDATIARVKDVRDRLASTTDVTTLTAWIERSGGYDKALRHLYDVLIEADGKVTNKVRTAFDAEQAARARLPSDTRPILVIMSDVAQGGMNQAVIAIQETHASLSDALAIQRALQQDVDIAPPE